MTQITLDEIKCAYKKFKSYIYYDNYSMILRQKLAEFENSDSFIPKLEELETFFFNTETEQSHIYINNLLSQVNYFIVPKSYQKDEISEDFILTNCFTDDHYEIEKVNYLIDAPIELHIISVLWILKEAYVLTKDYKKNNYAYELEIDSNTNTIVDGLRLFKPYFEQYQKWRDNSVETAINFIEKDVDVVIIGLDIKEYYYNIDYNSEKKTEIKNAIRKGLGYNLKENTNLPLTELLFEIHKKYIEKLHSNEHKKERNNFVPIGLLSSGVLANWYLKDFDYSILDNLSPAFYGRYVDDILIVLPNTKIPKYAKANETKFDSALELFFDKYFVLRGILRDNFPEKKADRYTKLEKENKKNTSPFKPRYNWIKNESIIIQKDKVSIHSFNSKESKAVLEKFKKNIQKNSSAFWFLPENSDISNSFDESVYELTYSDTINKLRSVSEIKQSKYGASVFLAKKIKLSLLSNQKYDEKTKEQILTFFKGRMNLEFSSVWEKVLTYFVINNDHESFWKFFNETINSIQKIKIDKNLSGKDLNMKLKRDLREFLFNCCAMAIALNPGFLNKDLEDKFKAMEDKK